MWNKFSVSIYLNDNLDWELCEKYITEVKKYGCNEIFTSIHLPEFSFKNQMDFLRILSKLVHKHEMELVIDAGGKNLKDMFCYKNEYNDIKVDYIRLDYGFDIDLVVKLYEAYGIKGFVLNASILSERELCSIINSLNKLKIEIRACHNFYPRPETGLDVDFVKSQYKMFKGYGIPVSCCVPNMLNPRLPLCNGLPTIESHRNMDLEQILLSCTDEEIADELLFGDESLNTEQLKCIYSVMSLEALKIKISLLDGISEAEKNIILNKKHKFRYDSNSYILRSQTSREMAEFGRYIIERNTIKRSSGDITIDNNKYQRYSGELQVILKNLPQDDKVNVVAKIRTEEMWKFKYFRLIKEYEFILD